MCWLGEQVLQRAIAPLREEYVKRLMAMLLTGVAFCHKSGIIHRVCKLCVWCVAAVQLCAAS